MFSRTEARRELFKQAQPIDRFHNFHAGTMRFANLSAPIQLVWMERTMVGQPGDSITLC